jgi:hypothetical protein
MRTKPNLSFAAADGRPSLRISKPCWQRIEIAYGHPIASPARRGIRAATREYLDWSDFEQTAAAMAQSRKRVHEIKQAARQFRQAMFVCPPAIGRQADHCARSLICRHMGLTFEGGRNGLQNLALKIDRDISKGCEGALADLTRQKDFGFRRGEAWERWVRRLTTILSKNGLPTQVRKDTEKTKAVKPSPFVSFIRELQACLPEKFRRAHTQRPDFEANIALSTAIGRSRRRRVTKSSPIGTK